MLSLLPVSVSGMDFPGSGLVLHLDVSEVEGVADGEPLQSGWPDQSRNGVTVQSDTPPTYVADAGSGYPAIRFNGSNQFLEANLSTGSEVSVFIVFAHRRETPLFSYRDTLIASAGTGAKLSLASSRSFSTIPDYPSFGALSGAGISVQTWVNGHDTADVTGDMFSQRYVVGSAVFTDVPASPTLIIGSNNQSGSNAGKNDIREVLVYNRALSDEERRSVQRYLGLKHDIRVVWRTLDDPIETFPHVLGSQQFGTHYSFGESGISTLDYARASIRQGIRVIKFRLSNKYDDTDGFTAISGINSLVKLARDQPEVKTILDLPITDYLFWVSSFSIPNWQNQLDENGLRASAQNAIYSEVYDLAAYLLSTYSGTGKRFYLGNWEGDWMLSGSFRDDPRQIPQNRIQGMIDWATIRQKAVDDAKANTPHSNVDVWFYLEMNKADWMREGLPCVANSVIPALSKLDMISISSYSVHKDNGSPAPNSRIHSDLDQVQSLIDAKPDPSIPGSRIIIGEYGWIHNANKYDSLAEFAQDHITTVRSYLSWPGGALRFILQWQFYNEATNNDGSSKEMNQMGPENDRRPLYYMHENFYRSIQRWVEDYYLRNGMLPSPEDYEEQADHILATISLSEYEPVLRFATYGAWKNYYFIDAGESANSAISGPQADPYATGVSNLVRYGLGMDKFEMETSRRPFLRNEGTSIDYVFPYDPEKTDLRWRVTASATMSDWNIPVFDSTKNSPSPDSDWLEVNVNALLGTENTIFYRLELNLLP